MKKLAFALLTILSVTLLYAQDEQKAGTIGSILATGEVTVIHDGNNPLRMGDMLYVYDDNGGIVTLKVTFPLMTQSKCRITSGRISQLSKGFNVYSGDKPDERSYREATVEEKNIIIEMISCSAGSFMMGGVEKDSDVNDDETSRHRVTLDGFMIGKYPVTQDQYLDVMGDYPSKIDGAGKKPATGVSWYDAIEFCNRLSRNKKLTPYYRVIKSRNDPFNSDEQDFYRWIVTINPGANGYRLPTEAEWEYACRAGTEMIYYWGNSPDSDYAWSLGNSGKIIQPVGTRKPNAWNIFDMAGNAWQWCWDRYGEHYDTRFSGKNPAGPKKGYGRVLRGGSAINLTELCRSSNRSKSGANTRSLDVGFRVVLPLQK